MAAAAQAAMQARAQQTMVGVVQTVPGALLVPFAEPLIQSSRIEVVEEAPPNPAQPNSAQPPQGPFNPAAAHMDAMLGQVRRAIATETAYNGETQHLERDGSVLYSATIAPQPAASLQPAVTHSTAATLGSASTAEGHPNGVQPVA
jgi:hypothetical protein